jgi:bifunctional non-homologous end joining protein LigD
MRFAAKQGCFTARFDLMFCNGDDLRKLTLLERKARLQAILPDHELIAFSRHRKAKARSSSRKGAERS